MVRRRTTPEDILVALATPPGGPEDTYGFLASGHSDVLAADLAEDLRSDAAEASLLLEDLESRGLAYATDRIAHGIHWRCWHLTATGSAAAGR